MYSRTELTYREVANQLGLNNSAMVKGWQEKFFEEAIQVTADCPHRRTFHSGRVWACQMGAYQSKLKIHAVFQSFSRKGNCLDNLPMENFFSLLKQEDYHGQIFHSYEELD